MASTWLVFTFGVSFTMDTILFTLETLILILILTNNSQSSSWSIAWMGVALYGAYAVDVTLDSSALKDAVVDCSTTWDGSEFQSPTVRDALIIRNESFIFIMDSRFTVKTRKCVPPLTKTMLMHKIATSCWIGKSPPCDSVAWRSSSSILSSRLQKHRLFMRNLQWKSMSSNSVRGFVRSRNNLGRLDLNLKH